MLNYSKYIMSMTHKDIYTSGQLVIDINHNKPVLMASQYRLGYIKYDSSCPYVNLTKYIVTNTVSEYI